MALAADVLDPLALEILETVHAPERIQLASTLPGFATKGGIGRNFHIDGGKEPSLAAFNVLFGVALTAVASDTAGGFHVLPGSHEKFAAAFRRQPTGAPVHWGEVKLEGQRRFLEGARMVVPRLGAGDIIVAHSFLAHGTSANTSDARRDMIFQRRAAAAACATRSPGRRRARSSCATPGPSSGFRLDAAGCRGGRSSDRGGVGRRGSIRSVRLWARRDAAGANFRAGAGSRSDTAAQSADAPGDPKAFLGAVNHSRTVSTRYREGRRCLPSADPAEAVFHVQKCMIEIEVASRQGSDALIALRSSPASTTAKRCLIGQGRGGWRIRIRGRGRKPPINAVFLPVGEIDVSGKARLALGLFIVERSEIRASTRRRFCST